MADRAWADGSYASMQQQPSLVWSSRGGGTSDADMEQLALHLLQLSRENAELRSVMSSPLVQLASAISRCVGACAPADPADAHGDARGDGLPIWLRHDQVKRVIANRERRRGDSPRAFTA